MPKWKPVQISKFPDVRAPGLEMRSNRARKNPGEMRRFIRVAALHAILKSTGNASPRV